MPISPEERQQRRDRINQTKPWLKSTGARTEVGKAIVSMNALKHGLRSQNPLLRDIAHQKLWEKEKARIRAIILKTKAAYDQSKAEPHSSWQEIFDDLDSYLSDR